jgi:hypothetical protein
MNQLFYLNRIYPFLPISKIYNSSDSSNTINYQKNIYNYFPISYDHLKNNIQPPLSILFQDSKVLSTCIQHTPYSNLIHGNLDKPCTGIYCKYKKKITQ